VTKPPTIEIWMPLHFSELNKAVSRMSEMEECAYLRLLRDYWLNGSPPDHDGTLARTVRYSVANWRKVRPALVQQFEVVDGRWNHAHLEERKAHANRVSQSKRRGPANAASNADANGGADGSQMRPQMGTHARLDVTSNSLDHLPSHEGSTDSQVSSGAEVVPLARTGR
jgi:uncharacterized protein YdaU (DUF1376 family)